MRRRILEMTRTINHKLEVSQNRCLRRFLRINWPSHTISNYELHRRTGTEPFTPQVQQRRWKWIGYVLCMPPAALPLIALRWTPDGHRKRGRPKETWRTEDSGEGDKGEQLGIGSPGTTSTQQNPVSSSGRGLMCFETRGG